jgi:Polysaccharide lyase family 4, domain II
MELGPTLINPKTRNTAIRGSTIVRTVTRATLVAILVSVPAAAYEAAQVTDGGTIKGKVVYSGEVGTRKVIPTKDPEVCGGIREEPLIVVGPDKGVADVVVYLKDVQKGKALAKPAAEPEINNHNCNFEPHVQAIPVGSIVIVNSDPVMHNTHGFFGKQTVFNQALPEKGMRFPKPVRKAGVMRVECDVHGWMLAWVYAAEHPYFAVTKKDGTFTIPDVPPGNYTLVAWQESTEDVQVPVTVKPREAVQQTIELKNATLQTLESKKK